MHPWLAQAAKRFWRYCGSPRPADRRPLPGSGFGGSGRQPGARRSKGDYEDKAIRPGVDYEDKGR